MTSTISLPQPYEFERGEGSECDVSIYGDIRHDDMFDMDRQDDFIESLDIFPVEPIVEPKVKGTSSSLKSVDLTSL